jgi:CheY-like chemotaxis protein
MLEGHLMNTAFETASGKSRVLIVDDNARSARSAQQFLEHTGNYSACAVNDPRQALEAARSFKPDLVVVDLIMAQADGLEVASQFEADWLLHGVPIVFLTSLITAEEAKDGRRVSGHRILPKPTSGLELIGIVAQNLPCCAEA